MNAASRMIILTGLAALGVLVAPGARAQSEVAPDHFDSPGMVPFDQSKAQPMPKAVSSHYQGKVTLSHRVRCNGATLAPGKYEVSLQSDGRTVELRLRRSGQIVIVQGTAYQEPLNTERGYVVVERRGNSRRLSVIHVGLVEVGFASDQGSAHVASGPASLEVLPLFATAS
jgi:hypothetical protein